MDDERRSGGGTRTGEHPAAGHGLAGPDGNDLASEAIRLACEDLFLEAEK